MSDHHSSPVWHPFTQHAHFPKMDAIVKTEGAYLIDEHHQRIFDAISSWWVITHGHRHPHIMNAIKNACDHWDQIIFAEYTHEPAEQLAQQLLTLVPDTLKHVFYSDSGSTAVEVALKMALGFFKNKDIPRSRIVVMQHSYHGDTIGAMSVGERGVFNALYEPLLFSVDRLPFPVTNHEQETLDHFELLCKTNEVAALLVEPLVLGAGGFKCYPAWVLTELKRIATHYSCLFIADEVMTGWGRTGTLFACEQASLSPDILCTAKGLTGGAVPLAATLCTAEIFNAYLSTDRSKTFYHSSSFTANPIACAAALANIDIWQNEPVFERIKFIEQCHQEHLKDLSSDTRFENVRHIGTIAAFDVTASGRSDCGYLAEIGPKLRAQFRKKNMLVRPLGNVIYLMPPYCATATDLKCAYEAIDEVVDSVTRVVS